MAKCTGWAMIDALVLNSFLVSLNAICALQICLYSHHKYLAAFEFAAQIDELITNDTFNGIVCQKRFKPKIAHTKHCRPKQTRKCQLDFTLDDPSHQQTAQRLN